MDKTVAVSRGWIWRYITQQTWSIQHEQQELEEAVTVLNINNYFLKQIKLRKYLLNLFQDNTWRVLVED